jgi:hypothetical protein
MPFMGERLVVLNAHLCAFGGPISNIWHCRQMVEQIIRMVVVGKVILVVWNL